MSPNQWAYPSWVLFILITSTHSTFFFTFPYFSTMYGVSNGGAAMRPTIDSRPVTVVNVNNVGGSQPAQPSASPDPTAKSSNTQPSMTPSPNLQPSMTPPPNTQTNNYQAAPSPAPMSPQPTYAPTNVMPSTMMSPNMPQGTPPNMQPSIPPNMQQMTPSNMPPMTPPSVQQGAPASMQSMTLSGMQPSMPANFQVLPTPPNSQPMLASNAQQMPMGMQSASQFSTTPSGFPPGYQLQAVQYQAVPTFGQTQSMAQSPLQPAAMQPLPMASNMPMQPMQPMQVQPMQPMQQMQPMQVQPMQMQPMQVQPMQVQPMQGQPMQQIQSASPLSPNSQYAQMSSVQPMQMVLQQMPLTYSPATPNSQQPMMANPQQSMMLNPQQPMMMPNQPMLGQNQFPPQPFSNPVVMPPAGVNLGAGNPLSPSVPPGGAYPSMPGYGVSVPPGTVIPNSFRYPPNNPSQVGFAPPGYPTNALEKLGLFTKPPDAGKNASEGNTPNTLIDKLNAKNFNKSKSTGLPQPKNASGKLDTANATLNELGNSDRNASMNSTPSSDNSSNANSTLNQTAGSNWTPPENQTDGQPPSNSTGLNSTESSLDSTNSSLGNDTSLDEQSPSESETALTSPDSAPNGQAESHPAHHHKHHHHNQSAHSQSKSSTRDRSEQSSELQSSPIDFDQSLPTNLSEYTNQGNGMSSLKEGVIGAAVGGTAAMAAAIATVAVLKNKGRLGSTHDEEEDSGEEAMEREKVRSLENRRRLKDSYLRREHIISGTMRRRMMEEKINTLQRRRRKVEFEPVLP